MKFKIKLKDNNRERQKNLDKKLVFSLSKKRIPNISQLKYIKKYLSSKEVWLLKISFLVIIISLIFSGTRFYFAHLEVVPIKGGEYIEGLIGSPKYISPLYSSVSDVDNDLAKLIYSSLFKRGKNGELVKDLVENYSISEDNKIYTFTIRENIKWHDNSVLTVDDIIYTFNTIQDASYKSPLRAGFLGVAIEKINERSFKFVLPEPYAAFLELLTFGILPSNLWFEIMPESASLAELNLKPIGSGPYMFKSLVKEGSGIIREYHLSANKDYYAGAPYADLIFKFYPNFEEAVAGLNNNAINGISYLPKNLKENILVPNILNFHKLYLPQLTAIFFNQEKNSALKNKSVRQALALAINRNEIVNNTLDGEAYLVDGPILSNSFAYNREIKKYNYNQEEASKLLEDAGWGLVDITNEDIVKSEEEVTSDKEEVRNNAQKILDMGEGSWRKKENNFLIIKLTTVERSQNDKIISAVKNYWEDIGVKTKIELFRASQIQTEALKPRNFESLFYGQVAGSDPDPYAFWHSSQVGENGFNIANFNNKEVDQLLEDARVISDIKIRQEKYNRFQEIITEEVPAIFMYSPTYTYIQSKDIEGFDVKNIIYPSDRFSNITEWYLKVGKKLVW